MSSTPSERTDLTLFEFRARHMRRITNQARLRKSNQSKRAHKEAVQFILELLGKRIQSYASDGDCEIDLEMIQFISNNVPKETWAILDSDDARYKVYYDIKESLLDRGFRLQEDITLTSANGVDGENVKPMFNPSAGDIDLTILW